MPPRILLQRLHPNAVPPERMSAEAAGFDLRACLDDGGTMTLEPGRRTLVPTGWAMAIPPGYEGQVRPRSGLALRHGVTVLNAPGTIDADYRGPVMVLLANLGEAPFEISSGSRIAQLVIAPVSVPVWENVEALPTSGRGAHGFGSTGLGDGRSG